MTAVSPGAEFPLRDGVGITFLDVTYTDGSAERYQVLTPSDVTPDSAGVLLSLVDDDALVGAVRFAKESGAVLPADPVARVSAAEQSNTSVVFDDRAVLKLFRRVVPGVHPDIELNRVLTRSGNTHVAQLLGSFTLNFGGEQFPLGMVSAFVPDSTDGWRLATTGTADFAPESFLLGRAVASVHAALSKEAGSSTAAMPVDSMRRHLESSVAGVPQLARHATAILRRYAHLEGRLIAVQRVHGDLHLGQVLRTPKSWLLIDFEGEPGQPLEQRRQPDSVLRDIAGMLRSFEYAGRDAEKNRTAFCEGYATESGSDPRAEPEVLAAYELDKAVYEAGYEARHRPDWLHIPLAAIDRLVQ